MFQCSSKVPRGLIKLLSCQIMNLCGQVFFHFNQLKMVSDVNPSMFSEGIHGSYWTGQVGPKTEWFWSVDA